jgi:hypothetical protein
MSNTDQHRINLSNQWEIDSFDNQKKRVDLTDVAKLDLPVGLVRKFNCPTGLDSNSDVQIEISNLDGNFKLLLNGTELALFKTQSKRLSTEDVSPLLEAFNALELDLANCEFDHPQIQLVIKNT